MSGEQITFSVGYDDASGMGLWCSACLAAGLNGDADLLRDEVRLYGTEWPLERFNQLAGEHLQAVHPA